MPDEVQKSHAVRVVIEMSSGKTYEWNGENAANWEKAVNACMFMSDLHGMVGTVPQPDKSYYTKNGVSHEPV